MPDGLDVLEVVESPGGGLADLLEASHWAMDLPAVPLAEGQRAVAGFLATEAVLVERMTKKGLRSFDCRAAVVSLAAAAHGEGCRLDLVLATRCPAVRPDDVLSGLRSSAGLDPGPAPLLTRLAQGPLECRRPGRRPAGFSR